MNVDETKLTEFLEESNKIEREFGKEAHKDARKAWDWALENYNHSIKIDYVLGVHKKLMQHLERRIAGKIRQCMVYVGDRAGADPFDVRELLDEWCNHWWKVKTEKEIQKAHIAFEKIHPFEDGNGRTGRILMNIQRVKAGLPLLVIHTGPEQYKYYGWFR